MADESKPQTHELWSPISATDLGLKAGYWTGEKDDPMTFRPLVGWITVHGRDVPSAETPKNGFYPVTLGPAMFPILAHFLEHYCGVFLKEMDEAQAKEAALKWKKSPPGVEVQPNVKGTGLA